MSELTKKGWDKEEFAESPRQNRFPYPRNRLSQTQVCMRDVAVPILTRHISRFVFQENVTVVGRECDEDVV